MRLASFARDGALVRLDATMRDATTGATLARAATLGSPAKVAAWELHLSRRLTRLAPEVQAELAWWRGIRAAHRGDAAGLESARAVLATSSAGATATLLDRSLAAFGRALAADTAGAAAVLVGLERERSQRRLFGNGHPYLTPVDRLAASRWLRVLGDTAQASELLTWTDAVAFYAPHVNEVNAMVAGVVYRERAALEEAAGRGQRAAGLYRQFIDRVDLPSARQRDRIAHARQFVAAWPPDLPRVRR